MRLCEVEANLGFLTNPDQAMGGSNGQDTQISKAHLDGFIRCYANHRPWIGTEEKRLVY